MHVGNDVWFSTMVGIHVWFSTSSGHTIVESTWMVRDPRYACILGLCELSVAGSTPTWNGHCRPAWVSPWRATPCAKPVTRHCGRLHAVSRKVIQTTCHTKGKQAVHPEILGHSRNTNNQHHTPTKSPVPWPPQGLPAPHTMTYTLP